MAARNPAEFFASVYDAKRAHETRALPARLQDILGAINDAAAVTGPVHRGFGGKPGRGVVEARGIMLGWSKGRGAMLRRELRAAWKAYRDSRHFW